MPVKKFKGGDGGVAHAQVGNGQSGHVQVGNAQVGHAQAGALKVKLVKVPAVHVAGRQQGGLAGVQHVPASDAEKRCAQMLMNLPLNQICASSAEGMSRKRGIPLVGNYLFCYDEWCLCPLCTLRQQQWRRSETQCIQEPSIRPSIINQSTVVQDAAANSVDDKIVDAESNFQITESMKRRKRRLELRRVRGSADSMVQ